MTVTDAFQELYDYARTNEHTWMKEDLDAIRECLEKEAGIPVPVWDRLAEEIGL